MRRLSKKERSLLGPGKVNQDFDSGDEFVKTAHSLRERGLITINHLDIGPVQGRFSFSTTDRGKLARRLYDEGVINE